MSQPTKKLMRSLPRFEYRGLTVVLSNPSRFDAQELLSGVAGYKFNSECLAPETNRFCCDVRLADDSSSFLPGTKCLLLLGQKSLYKYTGLQHHVGEQRGSPVSALGGLPAICSFLPQDAIDIQNYEKDFNPQAAGFDEDADKDYIGDKGHSGTARQNWLFWLKHDTKKAIRIVNNNGIVPHSPYEPRYIMRPQLEECLEILHTTKGRDFFIDIETDFDSLDMRCFAFSFGAGADSVCPVYIVPFLDITYKPAYNNSGNAQILRALAVAMRDNCTVAHNGAVFDYFVFAHKYHIPIGKKVYDTMIAQHRIYPETEKSLGHCVSMWTWEPYHKSEGVHTYANNTQADQLYRYCGKDVYTMVLIKEAQLAHASRVKGLRESIDQAMRSIRPYLICSLLGIRYDEQLRTTWLRDNDRLMTQYMRVIKILTGPSVKPLISNKNCCDYFHDQLGYPIVSRSKQTGRPSLGKDSLLKLRLQQENPVIDVLLKLREIQKESTGALMFEPWKK